MADFYPNPSGTGGSGGSGDVVGPASATNNAIVLFNGTTGKLIKDSAVLLSSPGAAIISAASAAAQRTAMGVAIGSDVQAYSAELAGLAGLASAGIVARTGSGTYAARTLTGPAAGITVSNGDGVSGNPTLALANDLAALEGISGTGVIPLRTGTDTYSSIAWLEWTAWTATYTLVGGTGNVAPVYSVNNARYRQIGNIIFWRLDLSGDAGADGAGTGQIALAMPVTIGANQPQGYVNVGTLLNTATYQSIITQYVAGGTTILLSRINVTTLTSMVGTDQAGTTREISLGGFYEI